LLTSPACMLLLCGLLLFGCAKSDESVLRDEFEIPARATLVWIRATPEAPGWFGREGLEIEAEFAFKSDEFESYREAAQGHPGWLPVPISDDDLIKMTGLRSYLSALEHSNKVVAETVPTAVARPVPSEEELLERWSERLPIDVESGLWSCRTAGDNIMYAKRVPCSAKPADLNDFMLAVLDFDTHKLRVHVHTSY
jgi:hypothetical protein